MCGGTAATTRKIKINKLYVTIDEPTWTPNQHKSPTKAAGVWVGPRLGHCHGDWLDCALFGVWPFVAVSGFGILIWAGFLPIFGHTWPQNPSRTQPADEARWH